MGSLLLQGLQNTSAATAEVATTIADKHSLTLWEMIEKGGWVMIPIGFCSLIMFYVLVDRFLTIRAASKVSANFIDRIKEQVATGNIDRARDIAKSENTPAARMIDKGLSRLGAPLADIEVAIENVGKIEIAKLEKNLSLMASVAGAAPMLGFLGTVTGMIQSFMVLANQKTVNVADMAGGIYEAMITTAAGLIVGIMAFFAYNYLSAILNKVIHNMEHVAIDFLDLLQEPVKK